MKAVFDTVILIDYLNGIPEAAQEIALYDTRLISVISRIETAVGAETESEAAAIEAFLKTFTSKGVDEPVATEAVRLRLRHGLKVPDAIIYATARVEGCLLVTRNTRDFDPGWPDVRVPYER